MPEQKKRINYYPFGGLHKGYNNVVNGVHHPYGYNGKEENDELGLNWLDYGARNYDASLGRWMNIDPLADDYRQLSPYNYVSNSPVLMLDPDGERISFSFQYEEDEEGNIIRDKNGNANITGVTMTLTGKVMNISGEDVDVEDAIAEISNAISSAFKGTTVDGVKLNTVVDLKEAKSMDEVEEDDHVFALAKFSKKKMKKAFGEDKFGNPKGEATGVTNRPGGMVAFLDVDYFKGFYNTTIGNTGERTAAHEFASHMLTLGHTKNPFHLTKSGGYFSYVTKNQLRATIGKNKSDGKSINRGTNYDLRFYKFTGRKILEKGEAAKILKR